MTDLHPKVAASALAGSIMTIGLWALATVSHITLPSEVATAVTTLVSTAVGYWVPS